MHKVRLSPAAAQDLRSVRDYIAIELHNPASAQKIVQQILQQLRILERYNQAGLSVQAKTGCTTDLRMLVCKSHLAFYRIEPDGSVSVARILNARQDAMRILFGSAEFNNDPK